MRAEMSAGLQRKVKRYGRVLKACRSQGQAGTVLLVLGLYFAFIGLLFGVIGAVVKEPVVWGITAFFLGDT